MDKQLSERLLSENIIDLAAFGEPFIANPDLPQRLKNDWPLNVADRNLFYGGTEHGYTDYPVYSRSF